MKTIYKFYIPLFVALFYNCTGALNNMNMYSEPKKPCNNTTNTESEALSSNNTTSEFEIKKNTHLIQETKEIEFDEDFVLFLKKLDEYRLNLEKSALPLEKCASNECLPSLWDGITFANKDGDKPYKAKIVTEATENLKEKNSLYTELHTHSSEKNGSNGFYLGPFEEKSQMRKILLNIYQDESAKETSIQDIDCLGFICLYSFFRDDKARQLAYLLENWNSGIRSYYKDAEYIGALQNSFIYKSSQYLKTHNRGMYVVDCKSCKGKKVGLGDDFPMCMTGEEWKTYILYKQLQFIFEYKDDALLNTCIGDYKKNGEGELMSFLGKTHETYDKFLSKKYPDEKIRSKVASTFCYSLFSYIEYSKNQEMRKNISRLIDHYSDKNISLADATK